MHRTKTSASTVTVTPTAENMKNICNVHAYIKFYCLLFQRQTGWEKGHGHTQIIAIIPVSIINIVNIVYNIVYIPSWSELSSDAGGRERTEVVTKTAHTPAKCDYGMLHHHIEPYQVVYLQVTINTHQAHGFIVSHEQGWSQHCVFLIQYNYNKWNVAQIFFLHIVIMNIWRNVILGTEWLRLMIV